MRFPAATPESDLRDLIREFDVNLDDPFFRAIIQNRRTENPAYGSSIFYNQDITIVTLIVSSTVALAKVLVEFMKNKRGSFEVEVNGQRIKYKGPMNNKFESRIIDILNKNQLIEDGKHDED